MYLALMKADIIIDQQETYTHYKITFNSLEDEYKDRVAEEGEYIERMKLVNVEINGNDYLL